MATPPEYNSPLSRPVSRMMHGPIFPIQHLDRIDLGILPNFGEIQIPRGSRNFISGLPFENGEDVIIVNNDNNFPLKLNSFQIYIDAQLIQGRTPSIMGQDISFENLKRKTIKIIDQIGGKKYKKTKSRRKVYKKINTKKYR
jgi:hypothetical protein